VFDVIPPRQYSGANAYRKDWQDFFATVPGPIISAEISDLSIMIDGKIALSHCIQHAVWTDKDGKKVDVTIRVTDGYRKIGGKWLIVHEHVSAPIDLTTGLGDFSGKQ
jgi:ketosteroid isomerase-like protein